MENYQKWSISSKLHGVKINEAAEHLVKQMNESPELSLDKALQDKTFQQKHGSADVDKVRSRVKEIQVNFNSDFQLCFHA